MTTPAQRILNSPEEQRALAYRAQAARRRANIAAAEAAMHGNPQARVDLGWNWEPVANRGEDPDYHRPA